MNKTKIRIVSLAVILSAGMVTSLAVIPAGAVHRHVPINHPSQGVFAHQVKVGVVDDYSSFESIAGIPFRDAWEAAFAVQNKKGGVYGRVLTAVPYDSASTPANDIAAEHFFTSTDPVLAITAGAGSTEQAAIEPPSILPGVPKLTNIGPASTGVESVNPYNKYFIGTQCPYAIQSDVGVAFGSALINNYHPKVAMLQLQFVDGQLYTQEVQERVTKEGGTFLGAVTYPGTVANLDTEAAQIAAMHPDLIFFYGAASHGVLAMKAFADAGVTNTPIISMYVQDNPVVFDAAPTVSKNFYPVVCYHTASMLPAITGVGPMIKAAKASGFPASEYNSGDWANGYVDAELFIAALKAAGPNVTRATLTAALNKIKNFNTGGLTAPMTFGKSTNNIGNNGAFPVVFNQQTQLFTAVGTAAQWEACSSNEYVTGSIAKWNPLTCMSPSLLTVIKNLGG